MQALAIGNIAHVMGWKTCWTWNYQGQDPQIEKSKLSMFPHVGPYRPDFAYIGWMCMTTVWTCR